MLSTMPELSPRSPRTMLLLGFAFVLLLGAGSGLAWLLARQGIRRPIRILLVTPQATADSGLEAAQGRAIGALVQDHLEHYGGFAVTSVTELPTDLASLRGQARTLLILTEPRRRGDDLDLSYRYVWGEHLAKGAPVPWVSHKAEALPPLRPSMPFSRPSRGR